MQIIKEQKMSIYAYAPQSGQLKSNDRQHFPCYVEQFGKSEISNEQGEPMHAIGYFNSNASICEPDEKIEKITKDTTLASHGVYEPRPSTVAFLEYKKRINQRLAELSNGMSELIKESISGVDSICNKVRECLTSIDNGYPKFSSTSTNNLTTMPNASNEYIIEELPYEKEERISETGFAELLSSLTKYKKKENRNEILKRLEHFIHNYNDFEVMLQQGTDEVKHKIAQMTNSTDDVVMVSVPMQKDIAKMSPEDITRDIDKLYFNEMEMQPVNIEKELQLKRKRSDAINENDTKRKRFGATIAGPQAKKEKKTDPTEDATRGEISANVKEAKSNGLIPLQADVYRNRGFPNLHQRLNQQIDNCDSLIGFTKLMERKKLFDPDDEAQSPIGASKTSVAYAVSDRKAKQKPNTVKSADAKQHIRIKKEILPTSEEELLQKHSKRKVDLTQKYSDSLWFSKKSMIRMKKKSKAKKKNVIVKIVSSKSIDVGGKPKKMSATSMTGSRGGNKSRTSSTTVHSGKKEPALKKYEVQSKSLESRLQWFRSKQVQMARKNIGFCDILDDLTCKDLLPIQSEYPRKDSIGLNEKHLKDSYLYKLVFGNEMAPTLENLIEPSSKKSIAIGNPKPIKTNATTNKDPDLKKLLPLMIDPERTDYKQDVIVMPVRVFYDNYPPQNRHQPVEMKPETSLLYRSPYNNAQSYIAQLPMMPVKDSRAADDNQQQPQLNLQHHLMPCYPAQRQQISTVLNNTFNLNQPPPPTRNSNAEQMPKLANFSLSAKKYTVLTNDEKKLWQGKYQKTNAQRLVQFVETQKSVHEGVPNRFTTREKKIMFKKSSKSLDKEPRKKKSGKSSLHSGSVVEQTTTYSLEPPINKQPVSRQKMLMMHMQKLNNHNTLIQHNIQKAIDVIESKMVDILSGPTDSASREAFSEMEKQITNVLQMMEPKKPKTPDKSISNHSLPQKALKNALEIKGDKIFHATTKPQQIKDKEIAKDAKPADAKSVKKVRKAADKSQKNKPSVSHSGANTDQSDTLDDLTKIIPNMKKKKVVVKFSPSFTTTSSSEEKFMISSCIAPTVVDKKPKPKEPEKEKIIEPKTIGDIPKTTVAKAATKTIKKTVKPATPKAESKPVKREPKPVMSPFLEDIKKIDIFDLQSSNEESVSIESDPRKKPQKTATIKDDTSGKTVDNKVAENATSDVKDEIGPTDNELKEFKELINLTAAAHPKGEAIKCSNLLSGDDTNELSPLLQQRKLYNIARQVGKALAKVENVYSEMNNSDDEDGYKTNDENDTSEDDLTPFVEAMQRTKVRKEQVKRMNEIEKSPSCYNIISFLDTLTGAREEPVEIQRTTMLYYCRVVYTPRIVDTSKVMEWVVYLCSPKAYNDLYVKEPAIVKPKLKRVSFQLEKVNRSLQIDLDPFVITNDNKNDPGSGEGANLADLKLQPNISHEKGDTNLTGDGELNNVTLPLVTAPVAGCSKSFLRLFEAYLKQPNLVEPLNADMEISVKEKHKRIKNEIKRKCKLIKEKHGLKHREYVNLLKTFYGILFIIMYSAFNFNIKCPSLN